MKKKSLLAIGLTLSLMLAMATPAFAATTNPNVNADGAEVTLPGSPDYTAGGNTQAAGQSYNKAEITSADGTKWETLNDDDAVAKANDLTGADINVWAKVTDNGTKIYKVDLAWGAMKFEYDSGSGKWDTTTHTYQTTGGGTAAWTVTNYLNGTNNKVAVTNHSNNAINAAFAYAMSGTKFNDANGVNNVIGNFFDTNDKSVAAALVLTNTYSDINGNVNDAAVAGKLAGAVALPTADAYNSTTGSEPTAPNATLDQAAGARSKDVFFAFSGTPDKGKGATLDAFKKVGVITVTVAPNNDIPLNRPPFAKIP
ncbi:MAG: hypothetical protein RR910_08725 [Acidaminococcaceae bacterium]